MDRSRRRSGVLIAGALVVLAAAPASSPLRAMRWLGPGADAAARLTRRPPECLPPVADPETAYLVAVGRAAFRDPLVLGGQASRAGLSCDSCHLNGRDNADFDFPGVSGAPGTADVTTFLFSPRRGDHIDNPKKIPDLGGLKSTLKVDQAPASPALETFVDGLVTQEFDGSPPPRAVIEGLAAYVRALDPNVCAGRPDRPLTAADTLADARAAVNAAIFALRRGDPPTAIVMIGAARSQLGLLFERYRAADLAPARQALDLADLDLAASVENLRSAAPEGETRLTIWLARSDDLAHKLAQGEARSLYNRAVLAAAAGESRHVPAKSISN